jgi:hypothetical protein
MSGKKTQPGVGKPAGGHEIRNSLRFIIGLHQRESR